MVTCLCQGKDFFWEIAEDTHCNLVANAMWQDGFDVIFVHFHLSNSNNLNWVNKFAKVRLLVTNLNEKFLQYSPKEEFYSLMSQCVNILNVMAVSNLYARETETYIYTHGKLIHIGSRSGAAQLLLDT